MTRRLIHSYQLPLRPHTRTRRARRAAEHRCLARRLLLERLEDRSLLAFALLAEYAVPHAHLADVSADARPDMLSVFGGDATVLQVRLGNANGSFSSATIAATGIGSHSVATGDFNGDQILDVATSNKTDVSLLIGRGDGTFLPPHNIALPPQVDPDFPQHLPPQNPTSIATGDFNGDGKLDLVVPASTAGYCPYSCYSSNRGFVNVLLGNGAGGFAAPAVYSLGQHHPLGVAVGDLDRDQKDDVVTSNQSSNPLTVLLGNGDGTLASPRNTGVGSAMSTIPLSDVDGDGKLDAVTRNTSATGLVLQKGQGDGTFAAASPLSGAFAQSAVLGDVNADGKLDLVSSSANESYTCTEYGYDPYSGVRICTGGVFSHHREAKVLLGNGGGVFSAPLPASFGEASGRGLIINTMLHDLTGDGLPELVLVNYFSRTTIASNDGNWNPLPTIAISDATVTEGTGASATAVFTVSVTGPRTGPVTVQYATSDSSATAADYTAKSGTLTFGPGESSKTISVAVTGDAIDEFDEQLFVSLSNASGSVITDAWGTGTILDNDAPPLFTINDVSRQEGNKGDTLFTFTVHLSAASGKPVSVNFATANGTATTAGNDYHASSGLVSFAPGQTTATITVRVRGDKKKEANETFFVNLSTATNATIADSQGKGTILNDDGSSSASTAGRSQVYTGFEGLLDLPLKAKKRVSIAKEARRS